MKKNDFAEASTEIWQEAPKNQNVKAIVLLLHGLNLKPDKMNDWSHSLSAHGAHVMRFSLHGHSGDLKHMKTVTADLWRKQFNEAVEHARLKAAEHEVPMYFVGFSLGALTALEWLSNEQPSSRLFDKMVLIAPALSVPWYSKFAINMLGILGRGFMLPSRSPQHYRANKGTSIAAYQALFALKESLETNQYKNANVNTLVLIDRNDELVNSREIQKIIERSKLGLWTLHIVDNRFAYDNFGFRHLMVDQEAMGKELWQNLNHLVLEHFQLQK